MSSTKIKQKRPRSKTMVPESKKKKPKNNTSVRSKSAWNASPRLEQLSSPLARHTTPKFQKTRSTAFEFVPLTGNKKSFKNVESRYAQNFQNILNDEKNIAENVNLELMNEDDMQEIQNSIGEIAEISESIQQNQTQIRNTNVNSMIPSTKLVGSLTVVLISSILSTIYNEVLKSIVIQYLTEIGIFSRPMTLSESILNTFGLYHKSPILDRIHQASMTNIKAQITLCCFASIVVIIISIWIAKIIIYLCRRTNTSQPVIHLQEEDNVQVSDNLKRLSVPKHLSLDFFSSMNDDVRLP